MYVFVKRQHWKKSTIKKANLEKGNIKKGNIKKGNIEKGNIEKGNIEKGNIEKRQQTKEFYQKERWHKQTGCYNESSMTSIVGIMKANQGCSLQVMKSHRIYIQSHGYRNRPDLGLVQPRFSKPIR